MSGCDKNHGNGVPEIYFVIFYIFYFVVCDKYSRCDNELYC
jgi:hypothetical protein